jgi:hypothetical protein
MPAKMFPSTLKALGHVIGVGMTKFQKPCRKVDYPERGFEEWKPPGAAELDIGL